MIGNMSWYTAKGMLDLCPSRVEGLDAGFRKVVPDFVVASVHHVEEASWDK